MSPDAEGKPLGNWWALEDGCDMMDKRFSEYEVTHYSVIEVPPISGESLKKKKKLSKPEVSGLQIIVGKHDSDHMHMDLYTAFTVLVDLSTEEPKLVKFAANTEEEAVEGLQRRFNDVLLTFFHSYRIVRI